MPKSAPKASKSTPEKPKAKRVAPRGGGKRHGTRAWVLQALESWGESTGMPTSDIVKVARELAEERIPEEAIRQSLRTLARQKVVRARRSGREKTYRLVEESSKGPSELAVPETPRAATLTSAADAALNFPHKLAVGEVLVLFVGETHVETASNVHGKVVLERHMRPRS